MNKKFGPAPDWLQGRPAAPDRSDPESSDPLKSLFSASRNARLGEEEDDVLLEAYRENAESIADARILAEFKAALDSDGKQPEPFADLYVAPTFTGDVPDVRSARIVVLNPLKVRSMGNEEPELIRRAQAFLDYRGAGPRLYRNALVFVAADSARMQELEGDIRAMLAWQAVSTAAGPKRLDGKQIARARTHHQRYRERVAATYLDVLSWILVPTQAEPEAHVTWLQLPRVGPGTLAERAAAALRDRSLLRTEEAGLADDIARVRNWLGDRVHASQLAEEFARQLYLPRITDEGLLNKAIQLALSAGIQGRQGRSGSPSRPFTAVLPLDPAELAENTSGAAAELLARLISLAPDSLRVTVQIDAQIAEEDRQSLETLLRTLRKRTGA